MEGRTHAGSLVLWEKPYLNSGHPASGGYSKACDGLTPNGGWVGQVGQVGRVGQAGEQDGRAGTTGRGNRAGAIRPEKDAGGPRQGQRPSVDGTCVI